jgi:hypothetical protein
MRGLADGVACGVVLRASGRTRMQYILIGVLGLLVVTSKD